MTHDHIIGKEYTDIKSCLRKAVDHPAKCYTMPQSSLNSHRMSMNVGERVMARNCELHWPLSMFFVQCGKPIIRSTQVRVVFQLMMTVLEERGLASADSEDIFICDEPLDRLTDMPYLHIHQLRTKVMAMLTISSMGRQPFNTTDQYKTLLGKLFPSQATQRISSQNSLPLIQVVPPQRVLWTMSSRLSTVLLGYASTQPVQYGHIVSLAMLYVSNHRTRLTDPRNPEIACLQNDELFNVLQISYIHISQMRGVLRDHVDPIIVD